MIHPFAALAEKERALISQRTKAALSANDAFRHPKEKISTFHTIDVAQDTRQRGPLSMERFREA